MIVFSLVYLLFISFVNSFVLAGGYYCLTAYIIGHSPDGGQLVGGSYSPNLIPWFLNHVRTSHMMLLRHCQASIKSNDVQNILHSLKAISDFLVRNCELFPVVLLLSFSDPSASQDSDSSLMELKEKFSQVQISSEKLVENAQEAGGQCMVITANPVEHKVFPSSCHHAAKSCHL